MTTDRPVPRDAGFAVEVLRSPAELAAIAGPWDALATATPTPFLTSAWVLAWWRAAHRPVRCVLLRDMDGRLRAGATVQELPGRGVRGAADVHSGDWGVVAADPVARNAAWRRLARLAHPVARLRLPALDESAAGGARDALEPLGFHLVELDRLESPALALPASYDELLAGVSRNLRSQLGRSRRALEREGQLALRTVAEPHTFAADLERFLRLEAAGWKGRQGTAVLASERTARLYRDFAQTAFADGRLRLLLLELDGVLVAGDLSCRVGQRTALLKTAYAEARAVQRPGLVLRGEALRAALEDGSTEYDFLGGPDSYKTRWGGELRPRRELLAVRGPWRLEAAYRERWRPTLGKLRRRWFAGPDRPPLAPLELDHRRGAGEDGERSERHRPAQQRPLGPQQHRSRS